MEINNNSKREVKETTGKKIFSIEKRFVISSFLVCVTVLCGFMANSVSRTFKFYSNIEYDQLRSGVFINDSNIIGAFPPIRISYDKNFGKVSDSIFPMSIFFKLYPMTVSVSKSKDKFLFVTSDKVIEYFLKKNSYQILQDSIDYISSAVYLGNSDSFIVYKTTSHSFGYAPGYFKYNTYTKKRELIYADIVPNGITEFVSGFDISPDGRTILVPLLRNYFAPMVGRYDIATKKMIDTVWKFKNNKLESVWLRYDHTGKKILYSTYSQTTFSTERPEPSEMGIIDISTKQEQKLNYKPDGSSAKTKYVAPFPNWSPDSKHIIYGMSELEERSGIVGVYGLYIKTNVEGGTTDLAGIKEIPKVKKLE